MFVRTDEPNTDQRMERSTPLPNGHDNFVHLGIEFCSLFAHTRFANDAILRHGLAARAACHQSLHLYCFSFQSKRRRSSFWDVLPFDRSFHQSNSKLLRAMVELVAYPLAYGLSPIWGVLLSKLKFCRLPVPFRELLFYGLSSILVSNVSTEFHGQEESEIAQSPVAINSLFVETVFPQQSLANPLSVSSTAPVTLSPPHSLAVHHALFHSLCICLPRLRHLLLRSSDPGQPPLACRCRRT